MTQILALAPRAGCSQRLLVEDRCDPGISERITRELEPYLRHAAVSIAMASSLDASNSKSCELRSMSRLCASREKPWLML